MTFTPGLTRNTGYGHEPGTFELSSGALISQEVLYFPGISSQIFNKALFDPDFDISYLELESTANGKINAFVRAKGFGCMPCRWPDTGTSRSRVTLSTLPSLLSHSTHFPPLNPCRDVIFLHLDISFSTTVSRFAQGANLFPNRRRFPLLFTNPFSPQIILLFSRVGPG